MTEIMVYIYFCSLSMSRLPYYQKLESCYHFLTGKCGGFKMKRHLTYTILGTILLLGHFLLTANLYVYASDVPYIAFSSNRSGNYDIYVMDINGKNLQRLTDDFANEISPTFSPDGQWMAYGSSRDGNDDIYVMNLKTKVSEQLTNHPSRDLSPAWSPDGRWIAFVSERTETLDIYKIEPSGANLQQLTHGNEQNSAPAWSPDSQFIAYRSFKDPAGIYIMDANGGNPSRLKNQPEPGWTPAWSPDRKRIAFTVVLGGNYDIYTLNIDGRDLRRITRDIAGDWLPAWHPNGHSMVFSSTLLNRLLGRWEGNSDIYHIEVNGAVENRRKMTRHPAVDMDPTWVPSGFLSVSPTAETQTTLWGRLKQSVNE